MTSLAPDQIRIHLHGTRVWAENIVYELNAENPAYAAEFETTMIPGEVTFVCNALTPISKIQELAALQTPLCQIAAIQDYEGNETYPES